MDYGTGHSAKAAIRLNVEGGEGKLSVNIPAYGKTGTANRFTNSSFVGFVPGPNKESGEMGLEDGYVVASYVGYDDNRPMKSRHISIYGSAGALPLWLFNSLAAVIRGTGRSISTSSASVSQHIAPLREGQPPAQQSTIADHRTTAPATFP
jgi:membrane peptidoglycan carboxypeptidase